MEKIFFENLNLSSLSKKEILMMGMFHYTVWGKIPKVSYEESLDDFKRYNPDIVRELLEIIQYNVLQYNK